MTDHLKKLLLFLVVSLTVRTGYIFLFSDCHSFDLTSWNQVADVLMAGGNPYHLTSFLNWPPCWMELIFCFKKISLAMAWPFNDVVRGFLILVESLLAVLLYVALIRFTRSPKPLAWLMAGIALNPIAIFQVCQHCNFDVLVGFWILLAVYMLLRFQEHHESRFWLVACLALGLGAFTKTVPLSLSPLLLLSVRKLKLTEQLLGAVLLLGPITLSLSILYVLSPADIEANVLGYRSTPGSFGFSGLFLCFGAKPLLIVWPRIFIVIYGLGSLALGIWLLLKDTLEPRQIVSLATVLLVAIPALGPGYGPQYVYWFLPLFVLRYGLEDRHARRFLLVLFGVATVTYTIEYALNSSTYGAFLLDIIQTRPLLDAGRKISSKTGETLVNLPLWLGYVIYVSNFCRRMGAQMLGDFKTQWRQG